MKIYTSYFYQVRFFPPNLVPLSTAVWDPKYFHDNKGKGHIFKDKRGVLCGLRADPFVPGVECEGMCRGPENCLGQMPPNCRFLLTYRIQLNKLDFKNIMDRFVDLAKRIETKNNLNNVDFALMVYEAPNKACSERCVIQSWFRDNGLPIEEWKVDNNKK